MMLNPKHIQEENNSFVLPATSSGEKELQGFKTWQEYDSSSKLSISPIN